MNSVPSPQERNTFNYSPLTKIRQSLSSAIHLPLYIVLPLSPDPPLCPLLCLMLCQHHLLLWSRQAQKWTFLLSCRWLTWLRQRQSLSTRFPAAPLAALPHCLQQSSSLRQNPIPVKQNKTFQWSCKDFFYHLSCLNVTLCSGDSVLVDPEGVRSY